MSENPITTVVPTIFEQHPQVCCGVSTRGGGVSPGILGLNLSYSVGDDPDNVAENRRRFFRALGIDPAQVAFPKQVHGTAVRAVNRAGLFEGCDALVTGREGVCLAVSIADCLPAFLYDPHRQAVAAVHAGWRGSKGRILAAAVSLLARSHGSRPADLLAYLGPSAGPCCYEVGEEVAAEFGEAFLHRGAGTRPHLDLKSYNRQLLIEAGVPASQIEVSDACTICGEGLFHSYRRDGQASGRMLGVIGRVNLPA